jgi:RHS repeat-associated protein
VAAAGVYDVRWDINADGAVTWADYNHYPDISMGRGVLSHVGNRFGYAGYQHAPELAGAKWHLRHRMMDSIVGRFMNRDPHPTPYVDGMNLYQYARGMALVGVDPMGRAFTIDSLEHGHGFDSFEHTMSTSTPATTPYGTRFNAAYGLAPWPFNGVVCNWCKHALSIWSNDDGCRTLNGSTAKNSGCTERRKDTDFVCVNGKWYKIGAQTVYVPADCSAPGQYLGTPPQWVPLRPAKPGEWVPKCPCPTLSID